MRVFEGKPIYRQGRFGIAVARYNESITRRLLDGACGALAEAGAPEDAIDVCWTPGAFEIPVVAHRMAKSGQYAAVLALGAVIRGETTHDEHINRAVSLELARASAETGVPVLFGVLTCNSLEQAMQRAGGTVGNKGAECAQAALEMIDLLKEMDRLQ